MKNHLSMKNQTPSSPNKVFQKGVTATVAPIVES